MKKTISILLAAILATGCISKRETFTTTTQGMNYKCNAEESSASVTGGRLWILFIPIGVGSFKYDNQKAKAIQRFMKHTKADAITTGQMKVRKIVIPLIVVNFSMRIATLKGKPCYLDSLKH